MLQISTGKFFTGEAYETETRAQFFTNYRMLRGDERIVTEVGSLQSVAGVHGLSGLTCEIVERIQKQPGGPYPGEIVSTGGDTLADDFAAIISFALNITCTTDVDLARRLTSSERPSLGADLVPQKYVARMFDRVVPWHADDAGTLQAFVADLVALDRRSYKGAMRAIRRFVAGAHRISDDMNLAYSLIVMSMESLAQKFDGVAPVWDDYDQAKRQRVDRALEGAQGHTIADVHAAILANEHVAISSRFREYVLASIRPSFFREEADEAVGAISRPDLSAALRQAYAIRSSYVHHLEDIPGLITGIDGYHDSIPVDGRPTLTFAGLSRLARHVIMAFISSAPRMETEDYDWYQDLPNKLTMPVAAQYWLGNPQGFHTETAVQYLEGFVEQLVGRLSGFSAIVTDMRPVLTKAESLVSGLMKPGQRLPMLALYYLFNMFIVEAQRCPDYPRLLDTHGEDFKSPSSISLAAHLLTGQVPDWPLAKMEQLHQRYFRERHHADTFNLGRVLEAAFTVTLAEQNRLIGNLERTRGLVSFAIEVYPQHAGLRSLEATLSSTDQIAAIEWQDLLLPALVRADPPTDQGTAQDQAP